MASHVNNLHFTNRTKVLLILFLNNDIPLPDSPHFLKQLSDLVKMNPTICDDIPRFLVSVGLLKEKAVLGRQIEDLK